MLCRHAVLEMSQTLTNILMTKVAEEPERCVKHLQTPDACTVMRQILEGRTAPPMYCGPVSDALLLVHKRLSAFGAWIKDLWRLPWRPCEICDLINTERVQIFVMITNVAQRGVEHVEPASLDLEGTPDKRVPL